MKKLTLAAMFALAAFALQVSAKTYYVKAEGGADVDPKVQKTAGLSEGAAFATIQFAIDHVAAGSTILVYPGEYGAIKSNNKKLTITAVDGLGSVTILPSEDEDEFSANLGTWGTQQLYGTQIVYNNGKKGPIVCDGRYEDGLPGPQRHVDFDIESMAGWVEYLPWETQEENGGVNWNKSKSVAVKGVKYPRWKSGSATKVIGVSFRGGRHSVAGGTLEYCEMREATDIAAWESSLTDCVITDCNAIWDTTGGYCTYGGMLAKECTLTRCALTANRCDNVAFYSTLKNCIVCDNDTSSSESWGGFFYYSDLYNCLVAGNESAWDIVYAGSVYNSTIADNELFSHEESYYFAPTDETDEEGYFDEEYGFFGKWGEGDPVTVYPTALAKSCKVYNTIVYGNFSDDGLQHNVDTNDFFDTVYTYKDAKGKTVTKRYDAKSQFVNSCTDVLVDSSKNKKVKSTGNIAGDPCFIAPERGDYRLAPWSQCVNKGADYQSKTGKLDLDGLARKVGAKVDMGAYELQASTPVPADYDGDGIIDAALYFANSGTWWIWGSQNMLYSGVKVVSLPAPKGATPIAANFDGVESGRAQVGYFAGAEKEPFFVYLPQDIWNDGPLTTNAFPTYKDASGKSVSAKGATPVAARLSAGKKATFGIYASTAKAPVYSFLDSAVPFGGDAKVFAKGSKPVVADFTGDGIDDLGAYTAAASKPAFTVLQSGSYAYSTKSPFSIDANFFYPTARTSIPLGAKNAIPCCADYDGDGKADFATYSSTASAPEFTRLFSTSKYSETRTLTMGNKGDVPVVGVYESGKPAAPAVWTGAVWTYLGADWDDKNFVGE